MSIPLLSPRRFAVLGLMLTGLILLADGAARVELARAVDASLDEGARVVAHLSIADD
jgi:hypothetical protein